MKYILTSLILMVHFVSNGQNTTTAKVYNPQANAQEEINKAIQSAKTENKNILVQIGGNWCGWCLAFNKLTTTDTALHNFLNKNYEVIHLNYSQENKNLPILAKLGYPQRFGFPVFVILDKNGNNIHIQHSAYLETADGKVGHDPKKVLEFLKNWSPNAIDPANYVSK